MLPIYKEIVERLFTSGLIKLLFTTETFALGVNMPAKVVVFSSLRKFDGVGFDYLPTLNYYQMAGRAGRQGIDAEGTVYSVIDCDYDTPKDVKRVIFSKIEPIISKFNLSYAATLSLYGRMGPTIYERRRPLLRRVPARRRGRGRARRSREAARRPREPRLRPGRRARAEGRFASQDQRLRDPHRGALLDRRVREPRTRGDGDRRRRDRLRGAARRSPRAVRVREDRPRSRTRR